MIYVHSLGRALQFYPGRTALARDGRLLTFRELHTRVEGIAATLTSHGFGAGDRLALLLPNGPDYIELVYACSMLGVIAVPLNTRLSTKEIDGVLEDARPRGILRHSSLAVPEVQLSWQQVIDQEPLPISSDPAPKVFYDPEAVLGLIYTSGTTGQPKGVMVTHGNVLADIHNFNYWMFDAKVGEFFSIPRALHTSEWQLRKADIGIVNKDHARFHAARHPLASFDICGIDRSAEAKWRVVSDRNSFVLIFGWKNKSGWPKELLLVGGVVRSDVRQNRRFEEGSDFASAAATKCDLRAMTRSLLNLPQDELQSRIGRERSQGYRFIERIPELQLLGCGDEAGEKFVHHRFNYDESLGSDACLPVVSEPAQDRHFYRMVQISIV
jgi:hypothetical protein